MGLTPGPMQPIEIQCRDIFYEFLTFDAKMKCWEPTQLRFHVLVEYSSMKPKAKYPFLWPKNTFEFTFALTTDDKSKFQKIQAVWGSKREFLYRTISMVYSHHLISNLLNKYKYSYSIASRLM